MIYYPLLDIIRYLAAFIVASSHFFLEQSNKPILEFISSISVEVFFVLSGFVLANQINLIIKRRFRYCDIWVFFVRRWVRTMPSYFIAIFITAFVFDAVDFYNVLRHLLYIQNFISDNPSPNFFSVGWSLSIEEWFYILFPLTMLVFYKTIKEVDKLYLYVSFGIISLSILLRYFIGSEEAWGEDVRRSVIFRLDAIVFGYLAYSFKYISNKNSTLFFVLLLPIFLLTMYLFSLDFLNKNYQNLFFILCGLFFSISIIFFSKVSIHFRGRSALLFNFLSKLSYPIYLFHLVFIPFFSVNNNYLLYIVALNIFAIVFHYGFEYQILKLRPKYKEI